MSRRETGQEVPPLLEARRNKPVTAVDTLCRGFTLKLTTRLRSRHLRYSAMVFPIGSRPGEPRDLVRKGQTNRRTLPWALGTEIADLGNFKIWSNQQ